MTERLSEELLPCPNPNCESEDVCVAHRANYVICRKCKMSGPVGRYEEEGVIFWNRLPRRIAPEFDGQPMEIPEVLKGGL